MFFHVSFQNHGSYFQFQPKVPEMAYEYKEGNIPRVCVCPTVYQCLSAISGEKELYSFDIMQKCRRFPDASVIEQPSIYVVIGDQLPYLPPNASDFRKNEEHWFLSPVVMKHIGYLNMTKLVLGRCVVTRNKDNQFVDWSIIAGEGKDVKIRSPQTPRIKLFNKE
jgi:hypothetical protein